MAREFKLRDYFGKEVTVTASLFLYDTRDYMKKRVSTIGIQLWCEDGPYATLTVSFGEFIGMKNAAYIDVNNCPWTSEILTEDIAINTGLTKRSGFCDYPLYVFKEEFLREIGNSRYEEYSKKYENYMR